ncbi:MAG: hypothetical protein JNK50_01125 [Bacteroidia bacterium]|nr:hypothetical protein [Bacteroidia bacterium]
MHPLAFCHVLGLKIFCFHENRFPIFRPFNDPIDLKSIPHIVDDFIKLPNGSIVQSGTILQRPLEKLPIEHQFLHHEGVVIGTTANKQQVILEMNETQKRSGIHDVNFKGFMLHYSISDLVVRHTPETPISPSLLLERAKKYRTTLYDVTKFNCQDLAHWLVFAERRSFFKEKQLERIDDLIAYFELMEKETPSRELKPSLEKDLQSIKSRKAFLKKEIELIKKYG